MKNLIILAILLVLVHRKAAAQTTTIHFFNASGMKILRIQPANTTRKTVDVRALHWARIQTNSDSLGILSKSQPYFIHFERGKTYYFIAQSDYMRVFVVNETSEREFLLTVLANNSDKSEDYTLDNSK